MLELLLCSLKTNGVCADINIKHRFAEQDNATSSCRHHKMYIEAGTMHVTHWA